MAEISCIENFMTCLLTVTWLKTYILVAIQRFSGLSKSMEGRTELVEFSTGMLKIFSKIMLYHKQELEDKQISS